jgi:putative addiction module killer protein
LAGLSRASAVSTHEKNIGEHTVCRDGTREIRVDGGAGYRVHYARVKVQTVLLLRGGDERTQDAGLQRALKYWQGWQPGPA